MRSVKVAITGSAVFKNCKCPAANALNRSREISGTVSGSTNALIPGVTIKATTTGVPVGAAATGAINHSIPGIANASLAGANTGSVYR